MNLSQLSDDDLQALRAGDLSKVSSAGLMALRAPQTQQKPRDLADYAGLGARAVAKGAAAVPAMLADAFTGPLNFLQDKVLGEGRGYRFQQQLPALDRALSAVGVPEPQTPGERITSKALEVGTGAGAAAKGAEFLARGATGLTQNVLQSLAANPATQVAGGIGAGAAGQQSAESGSGFGGQLVSSLLGGLAGAGGAAGVTSLANRAAKPNLPPMQEVERRIMVALEGQGVDPRSVTPAMKSALMQDVRKALAVGESTLDETALARLADYRRLNLTPTRGRLTLDPLDVTREQNAMRLAAATGNADAQLPQIAQANNRGLLNLIESSGPNPDAFLTGSAAMNPILSRNAAMEARVNSLYSAARDQFGRSAPLDGAAFTRMANEALKKNLAPKLGDEVDNLLNDIATGKTPLNVEFAEQLKTMLGRKAAAARGTNGDLSFAYGLVRQALDDTPLMQAPRVNPGNLPAVPGTVPPSQGLLGAEAIDAFNSARGAARERFSWRESAPAIAKALDGATPETFIKENVLSSSAGFKNAAALAQEVRQDPAALDAVRGAIVQHLKEASMGKGNEAATANFSGRGLASALQSIGDRKLGLFFSPEEVAAFKSAARVGSAEVFQPRGSAVNNSNTAAMAANLVGKVAERLPFGREALSTPLRNLQVTWNERTAQDIPRGLLAPMPKQGQPGLLESLVLPGFAAGGLLAGPQ